MGWLSLVLRYWPLPLWPLSPFYPVSTEEATSVLSLIRIVKRGLQESLDTSSMVASQYSKVYHPQPLSARKMRSRSSPGKQSSSAKKPRRRPVEWQAGIACLVHFFFEFFFSMLLFWWVDFLSLFVVGSRSVAAAAPTPPPISYSWGWIFMFFFLFCPYLNKWSSSNPLQAIEYDNLNCRLSLFQSQRDWRSKVCPVTVTQYI